MDPLSIAASTAGLLTLTAQIITRGYACMMRLKSNDEDVRAAVNDVSSFSGILMAIESQCKDRDADIASPMRHLILNNQPLWKKKVEECEAVLVEMNTILDALASANKVQLIVKGNSLWEKLQKSTTQVETSKSFFILCLQLQNNEDIRSSQKLSGKIMSSLDLLRDEQDRLRRETQLKERREQQQGLMEWLGFPGEAVQDDILNTGHPDSSLWLIEREEFIDWLTCDGQSGFWLKGSQGSGKTVIVSRVIEFIQNQCLDDESVLLYHFCRFTDEATRSQDRLVGALITQLLDHLPDDSPLPDALTSMLKRSRFTSYPRIARLKNAFHDLCKVHSTVYIVIDGFDELDSLRDILGFLRNMPNMTIKVFVASRQNTELKTAFSTYKSVEIMAEDVEPDVQMFVRDKLEELLSGDEEEIDPAFLVMELSTRADGMFLWAVCQVQYLSSIRTTITPDVIATLPPALESIYENVLTRLDNKDRKMALRILQIVMFACRPLDLSEIDEAIAVTASTRTLAEPLRLRKKDQILELCGCMLSQSPRTKKVQLAHSSVYEFFTQKTADPNASQNQFFLDETGSHRDLFKICIQYLSMKDFDSDTFRETFRLAQDGSHADSDLQAFAKAPLLDYAVNHLVSHMKRLKLENDPDDGGCFIMANNFFFEENTKLASWLLVQQYLHGTYKTPPGSNALHIAAIYGLKEMFSWAPNDSGLKAQTLDGRNVLHLALENQQWDVIDLVMNLRQPDLLQDFDQQGRSPLHVAVELGNAFMVQRLIAGGADANLASTQNQGRTPIFMAVENKWDELSTYLSNMANLDICLDDGRSLQHVAAQSGSWAWITALQRDNGGSIAPHGRLGDPRKLRHDGNNWTPLHYAADLGHTAVIPQLMADGYKSNEMDKNGWTPLHAAIRRRYLDTATALLEHTRTAPQPDPLGEGSYVISQTNVPGSSRSPRTFGYAYGPRVEPGSFSFSGPPMSTQSSSGKYGAHFNPSNEPPAPAPSQPNPVYSLDSLRAQITAPMSGLLSSFTGRTAQSPGQTLGSGPQPPIQSGLEALQPSVSMRQSTPPGRGDDRFPANPSPTEGLRFVTLSPLYVAVADAYTKGVELLVQHREKLSNWGLAEAEKIQCLKLALGTSNIPIVLLLLDLVGFETTQIQGAISELIAADNDAINAKVKEHVPETTAYDALLVKAFMEKQLDTISFILRTWPKPTENLAVHAIELCLASMPSQEPQDAVSLAAMVDKFFTNYIEDTDPAKQDSTKSSLLTHALSRTSLRAANFFIDEGANVHFRNDEGETPLLYLPRIIPGHANDTYNNRFLDVASQLVDRGADPFATDLKGHNLCHKAASHGNAKLMEWALQKRVSPTLRNAHARTPLVLAVERGSTDCVRVMLDFLMADDSTGVTTLSTGLGRVVDVMDYGKMRTSPLLRASIDRPERKLAILALLVGVDERAFSALDTGLRSDVAGLRASLYADALCWTIDCSFPEGFEFLLPRVSTFASLSRRSIDGETVLHGATRAKEDDFLKALLQKIEALEDQGKIAEVINIQDTQKRTPLVLAVEERSMDKVSALLRAGAKPTQTMIDHTTDPAIVTVLKKYFQET